MPLLPDSRPAEPPARTPRVEEVFPLPETAVPLALSLSAAAAAWVGGEPLAAAVGPEAVEVPLARLKGWSALASLPPGMFVAVLRAVCATLVDAGFARASWRGPRPEDFRSRPTGGAPWEQANTLGISTDLGIVPSKFFAALTPGLRRHYVADAERRSEMEGLARAESGGEDHSAWVLLVGVR